MKPSVLIKRAYSHFMYNSGLLDIYSSVKGRNGVILAYHRVLPDDDPQTKYIQPGMYVTTKTFEKHMKYISKAYSVISLEDVLKTSDFTGKCIVTFDDGWLDNYEYAYPIMREYGIPATIFLSTNLIESYEWHWTDKVCYYAHFASRDKLIDLLEILGESLPSNLKNIIAVNYYGNREWITELLISAIKALDHNKLTQFFPVFDHLMNSIDNRMSSIRPWLRWDEIKEMSKNGISFGAHTHNHVILTNLTKSDAENEIVLSQLTLSRMIDNPIEMFSYPNGNYNNDILKIVRERGFKLAVTTKRGSIAQSENLLLLRRIMLHEDMASSIPMVACRLLGITPFN